MSRKVTFRRDQPDAENLSEKKGHSHLLCKDEDVIEHESFSYIQYENVLMVKTDGPRTRVIVVVLNFMNKSEAQDASTIYD